jgi:isopropylmalate/homocitrate/citramalate synthase
VAGNVFFIDVTNRDGVQTSRILLPKLAKTLTNLYLDEMGLFQSEIGFPTSEHCRQDTYGKSLCLLRKAARPCFYTQSIAIFCV